MPPGVWVGSGLGRRLGGDKRKSNFKVQEGRGCVQDKGFFLPNFVVLLLLLLMVVSCSSIAFSPFALLPSFGAQQRREKFEESWLVRNTSVLPVLFLLTY